MGGDVGADRAEVAGEAAAAMAHDEEVGALGLGDQRGAGLAFEETAEDLAALAAALQTDGD